MRYRMCKAGQLMWSVDLGPSYPIRRYQRRYRMLVGAGSQQTGQCRSFPVVTRFLGSQNSGSEITRQTLPALRGKVRLSHSNHVDRTMLPAHEAVLFSCRLGGLVYEARSHDGVVALKLVRIPFRLLPPSTNSYLQSALPR